MQGPWYKQILLLTLYEETHTLHVPYGLYTLQLLAKHIAESLGWLLKLFLHPFILQSFEVVSRQLYG